MKRWIPARHSLFGEIYYFIVDYSRLSWRCTISLLRRKKFDSSINCSCDLALSTKQVIMNTMPRDDKLNALSSRGYCHFWFVSFFFFYLCRAVGATCLIQTNPECRETQILHLVLICICVLFVCKCASVLLKTATRLRRPTTAYLLKWRRWVHVSCGFPCEGDMKGYHPFVPIRLRQSAAKNDASFARNPTYTGAVHSFKTSQLNFQQKLLRVPLLQFHCLEMQLWISTSTDLCKRAIITSLLPCLSQSKCLCLNHLSPVLASSCAWDRRGLLDRFIAGPRWTATNHSRSQTHPRTI